MCVNKRMLTYGLVKQDVANSKGGRSTWSPYARNTWVISPTAPTPNVLGTLEPSVYARRPLRKQGPVPKYTIPEIKRSSELITLLKQLATFSGQFMANRPLPPRAAKQSIGVGPDSGEAGGGEAGGGGGGGDGGDGGGPGPGQINDPLAAAPGEEPETSEEVPPLSNFYQDEDGVVSVYRGSFRDGALDMIRNGVTEIARYNPAQMGVYLTSALPVVQYFVDTGRLTENGMITLLFGQYAQPIISTLRRYQELRAQFTDAISEYVAQPAVLALRNSLLNRGNGQLEWGQAVNYLGDVVSDLIVRGPDSIPTLPGATPTQNIPTSTEPIPMSPADRRALHLELGQSGRRSGPRLVELVISWLSAQAQSGMIEAPTTQAIMAAPGTGLIRVLRNTEARQQGPGYYTFSNMLRRRTGFR